MSSKTWLAILSVVVLMGCPEEAPDEGENEWPSLAQWAVPGRCLEIDQSLEFTDTVRGEPLSFYQGVAAYSGTMPLLGYTVGLETDPELEIGDMWGTLSWRALVDCEDVSNQGWLSSLIDVGVVLDDYGVDYADVGSAMVYVWDDETWASVTVTVPGDELTAMDLDPGYDLALEIHLTEDGKVGMLGILGDGMGDECVLFHSTGGTDHLDWDDWMDCN